MEMGLSTRGCKGEDWIYLAQEQSRGRLWQRACRFSKDVADNSVLTKKFTVEITIRCEKVQFNTDFKLLQGGSEG